MKSTRRMADALNRLAAVSTRFARLAIVATTITASVLATSSFLVADACAAKMIQVKGSDTLINLVQTLAEVYMKKHPEVAIAVTGGGSGTGIAALINGKCDIANASRMMKPKEIAQANDRGVKPQRIVVAIDGLCIIVNDENPVDKLTTDQLGKMFRGEITNWKEVGGDDRPVTLYGRQSNSGTYVFFAELVLKGDYSQKMNRMNGNAQIVESIKQDLTGIGYVGVGYVREVKGIKVLKVASKAGGYYGSPLNDADIKAGKYPIVRGLEQYTNGTPKGMLKDFIAFELSEEGQKIVEKEGFFALTPEYAELNKKAGL